MAYGVHKILGWFVAVFGCVFWQCNTAKLQRTDEKHTLIYNPKLARIMCLQYGLEGPKITTSRQTPPAHNQPLYEFPENTCRTFWWQRNCATDDKGCDRFLRKPVKKCSVESFDEEGEYGDYEEGDIVPDNETEGDSSSRAGLKDEAKRWPAVSPHRIVPYAFEDGISDLYMQLMKSAMEHIQYCTCIKFVERSRDETRQAYTDYLYITTTKKGCNSKVGRQGGKQGINFQDKKCSFGSIVHEFVHAIGFRHEQARPDRDEYVEVYEKNVKDGRQKNFKKMDTDKWNSFNTSYDYASIMHYSSKAFSKNGKDTIVPKQAGVNIGQREFLSVVDAEQIRKMNECTDEPSPDCVLYNQIIINKRRATGV